MFSFILFAGIACAQKPPTPLLDPEETAAVVNGTKISNKEVLALVRDLRRQNLAANPDFSEAPILPLWRGALQYLIGHQLLKGESVRRGYESEEGEIGSLEGSWPDPNLTELQRGHLLRQYGGPTAMRLHRERNQLDRFLESPYTDGLVTEETIQAMFKTTPGRWGGTQSAKARQILIRPAGSSEEEIEKARAKATEIYNALKNGEATFEEMARSHSQDHYAGQGGFMGIVQEKRIVPPVAKALFSLQPGEISEPVHSGLGFHIVQLEEKIPAKTLDEVRDQIEQDLRRNQLPKGKMLFLQRLSIQAAIELGPEPQESDLLTSLDAAVR